MNKHYFSTLLLAAASSLAFIGCKGDDPVFCPSVQYNVELNKTVLRNGDSLYGRVVVLQESLIEGMEINKIDCRLGNIVIGTTTNEMECPFGVKLKDKPAGTHIFSVIIKCNAPDYDETFLRYDLDTITINN